MAAKPQPKHKVQGDPLPPLQAGVTRLYSYRFCPFAQRARLVLAAKAVDYELVNINLKAKPEWYFSKNPLGTTPCYEKDNIIVRDSTIVCEYLNDIYPNNPLWPSDPYAKALDRQLVDFVGSKVYPNMSKATFHTPEGKDPGSFWPEYIKQLENVENEFVQRDTPFIGGSTPNMADYLIWPSFERWAYLPDDFPIEKFPKVSAWCDKMKADRAVIEAAITPEAYKKHLENHRAGVIDAD